MVLRIRAYIQQLRERQSQLFALEEVEQTKRQRQLQKHKKRLVKTSRTIHLTYASMMVGVAECLPLGLLQGTSFRNASNIYSDLCSGVLAACARHGPDVYALARHYMVPTVGSGSNF